MIIRSLRLQNYRKYKDASMEFPDGLFGIVGANGTGKTTLIEAIAWSIYGAHASKTGQDLLKREQADPDSDCRVELEFSLGSDSYRVVRELRGRRNAPYAVVYVNNGSQPEIEGTQAVTHYLSKQIGMDYASFFTSIFAKQKELDALSSLAPGARQKRILRLLGIDRIDTAREKVRRDTRELKTTIDAIRGTLQDMDALNSALDQLRSQKTANEDAASKARAALQEAKTVRVKAKKVKDVLEKKYNRYRSLKERLNVISAKQAVHNTNLESRKQELDELRSAKRNLRGITLKLKPFPSVKAKKERLDALREKYLRKQDLEQQVAEATATITKLKDDRKALAEKLQKAKNLDASLKAIKKAINDYQKSVGDLDGKIAALNESIKKDRKQRAELNTQFEEIKKLGPKSKCPVCKKVIGREFPELVSHFRNELGKIDERIKSELSQSEELSNERSRLQEALENKMTEPDSINQLLEQRIKVAERMAGLDEQIERENKQLKRLRGEIKKIGKVDYNEAQHESVKERYRGLSKLDQQRIELQSQVSRIPQVEKTISKLKESMAALATKATALSRSIDELAFDKNELEQAKSGYDAVDKDYHERDRELIEAKHALANTKKDIASTLKQISSEKIKKQQIAEQEQQIEILNRLEALLDEFRTELISRKRPLLSIRSSELFRRLTDGKYPNIIINENYDILIEDVGKHFPLKRFSGGEEDLASLCLRIAISQVIAESSGGARINFIALDEIFGSQDETRRNNILRALNDLSSQFRQIIVITHVEDVKELLPYAFNVIETADGASKIIPEGSPSMTLTA